MALKLTPQEKKDVFHLQIEQAVLVPSTKSGDKPISKVEHQKRVTEVRKYLSQKFGGYTSVKAVGGYYSEPKKKVIQEKVVRVTGFATKKDYKKNAPAIKKQLRVWSKKWGQESMGYEQEGDLYYFPRSKTVTPIKKKMMKKKMVKKPKSMRRKNLQSKIRSKKK